LVDVSQRLLDAAQARLRDPGLQGQVGGVSHCLPRTFESYLQEGSTRCCCSVRSTTSPCWSSAGPPCGRPPGS
jgi:hypothetical protein